MTGIVKKVTTGLVLCGLLVPVAAAPAWAEKIAAVSVGLTSNKASKEYLGAMISSMAADQGVYLSAKEFQTAGKVASEKLKEPEHQPQKGIFHLKFKRVNLCIAWGETRFDCP